MSGVQPRIRVLIVDDHELVRRGLAMFVHLAPDLELVGDADSGEEGVRLGAQLQPDVVLMDMVLPGMDGVAATRAVRAACPHVRVIALTSFLADDLVHRALEAGAMSYLLKDIGAVELGAAIRDAYHGRPTLAAEAVRTLVQDASKPPRGPALTTRERNVLGLMTRGLTNPAIGQRLALSRSTVEYHVSHILSKLDVASRTEAVAFALQHHLID